MPYFDQTMLASSTLTGLPTGETPCNGDFLPVSSNQVVQNGANTSVVTSYQKTTKTLTVGNFGKGSVDFSKKGQHVFMTQHKVV